LWFGRPAAFFVGDRTERYRDLADGSAVGAMMLGMMANPRPRSILSNGVLSSGPERTFVVCGVQRGGTSAIAAVMRALGVDMGKGGFSYEDPTLLHEPDDLDGYIARRNADRPIWGVKIPHLALSLDLLAEKLRAPMFVLTFRNPVAIADSAIVRGDFSFVDSLERIQTYFDAMFAFARKTMHPVLLVSYERAVAHPEQFVEEFAGALALQTEPQQRTEAVECITGDGGGYTHPPERWHHVDVEPLVGRQPAVPLQSSVVPGYLNIRLVSEKAPLGETEVYFWVDYPPNADPSQRWVQLLVDFGDGFDIMHSYNLRCLPDQAIRFLHNGQVRRLAFGFLPEHPPFNSVWLLR
jgi:hypothetical protein